MTAGEALSIVTSILSFVLGGLSVWLALHFYTKAKDTEKNITNSLAKIEAQTTALQKINAKWMDRLTVYVTSDRQQPHAESMSTVLTSMLFDLPQTIAAQINKPTMDDTKEQLVDELITCYIVIHYYSALTNFWAQFHLPAASEFDQANEFHDLVLRTIDGSQSDFKHIAGIIQQLDRSRVAKNQLSPLLRETRDNWRHYVRSSTEVFEQRDQVDG